MEGRLNGPCLNIVCCCSHRHGRLQGSSRCSQVLAQERPGKQQSIVLSKTAAATCGLPRSQARLLIQLKA